MCGIFGWQWKNSNKPTAEKRAALAVCLGLFNESRGTDSYGYHAADAGLISKGVGRIAPHAMGMHTFNDVLGHTRHATAGDKTKENAHPFSMGRIIGAHNGVISNHFEMNKEREEAGLPKFEVDSQHIFDALDAGINLKHLNGYGAIEWTDKEYPGQIFLCRVSASGDLAIAQTPQGVVWSSDKDHLEASLLASGIKYTLMEVSAGKVYLVEKGKLYVTENKLSFGGWNGQTWQGGYHGTAYGSSGARREDVEEIKRWFDEQVGGSDDTRPFTNISKRERKRLIKERNEKLRKQSKGSPEKSSLAKYKDICGCGAWIGDGHPHHKWCDQYKPEPISRDVVQCDECAMFSVTGNIRHEEWCGKLVVVEPKPTPVISSKLVLPMKIGEKWCCSECKSPENPDDGQCPNGHGKVSMLADIPVVSGQK